MQTVGSGIWVVAANHDRARLFRALTETAGIVEAETLANPDAGSTEAALHRHDAGQSSNSTTNRRSAMQSRTEGRKGVDQAFARSVAKRIEALRNTGELRRLHVVADPSMLGLLRHELSKDSARLVVSEAGHDPEREDETSLRALLPKSL